MALFLALYGCLVLTHVLTAGIVVAILAMLTLSRQLKQRSVLIVAAVMFVAWQIYGADSFFSFSQDRIEDNILDLQDFFNLNVGSRLAGAPDHVVVGRLRMAMTLIAGGVALICFLMRITERHDRRNLFLMRRGSDSTVHAIGSLRIANLMYIWQPAPFAVFCFLGLVVIAPLYVYGGEMLIRSLLFSLPAFALLVGGAFAWRTPAIAVVAMFALVAPLHMVARYGNEAYDYVSPQEVEGFNFVSTLGPANIYGAYPAAAFENTRELDWRYGIKPGKSKPPNSRDIWSPTSITGETRNGRFTSPLVVATTPRHIFSTTAMASLTSSRVRSRIAATSLRFSRTAISPYTALNQSARMQCPQGENRQDEQRRLSPPDHSRRTGSQRLAMDRAVPDLNTR